MGTNDIDGSPVGISLACIVGLGDGLGDAVGWVEGKSFVGFELGAGEGAGD